MTTIRASDLDREKSSLLQPAPGPPSSCDVHLNKHDCNNQSRCATHNRNLPPWEQPRIAKVLTRSWPNIINHLMLGDSHFACMMAWQQIDIKLWPWLCFVRIQCCYNVSDSSLPKCVHDRLMDVIEEWSELLLHIETICKLITYPPRWQNLLCRSSRWYPSCKAPCPGCSAPCTGRSPECMQDNSSQLSKQRIAISSH